jgi:hypothetical protein
LPIRNSPIFQPQSNVCQERGESCPPSSSESATSLKQPSVDATTKENRSSWNAVHPLNKEKRSNFFSLNGPSISKPSTGPSLLDLPSALSKSSSSVNEQQPPPSLDQGEQKDIEAVALYDFAGTTAKQLSFKAGEVLLIHTQSKKWWMATRKGTGEKGLVPSNFVKVNTTPPTTTTATAAIPEQRSGSIFVC